MNHSSLQYALNLLKLRDRTVGEIKDKMKQKGFENSDIIKAVEFLKDKDFINDERFVINYIRSKQSFGSAGKYKIKFKLEQLKVDRELIGRKLSEISPDDEESRAKELARNWLSKKQSVPAEKRYEKLGRFLIARGFEISIVRRALEDILKKNS